MSLSKRKQSLQDNVPHSPRTNAILCNDINNEIQNIVRENHRQSVDTCFFETCQDWFIIYSWNYPLLSNLLGAVCRLHSYMDKRQHYGSTSDSIGHVSYKLPRGE